MFYFSKRTCVSARASSSRPVSLPARMLHGPRAAPDVGSSCSHLLLLLAASYPALSPPARRRVRTPRPESGAVHTDMAGTAGDRARKRGGWGGACGSARRWPSEAPAPPPRVPATELAPRCRQGPPKASGVMLCSLSPGPRGICLQHVVSSPRLSLYE